MDHRIKDIFGCDCAVRIVLAHQPKSGLGVCSASGSENWRRARSCPRGPFAARLAVARPLRWSRDIAKTSWSTCRSLATARCVGRVAGRGWARKAGLSGLSGSGVSDDQRRHHVCPECPHNEPDALWGGCNTAMADCAGLRCDVGHKAIETENVEHAGEIVAERHQAPFAANLVEAANEEVPIAGAAFDGAEGVLDKR